MNDGIRQGAPGNGDRDPGLDRVYGSTAREEPPARLDAAILAAAHREAGARPRPLSALRTWRVPVSIAAVVVLSVSLVTVMREEGGENLMQTAPPVPRRSEPAAPPARTEADAGKAPAEDARAAERAARADAPARRAAEAERNRAASEPHKADSGTGAEPARRAEPRPFPTQPENMGERPASAPSPAVGVLGSSVEGAPPAPQAAAGAAAETERPAAARAAPPPPRAMRSPRDTAVLDDGAGRGAAGPAAAPPPAAEQSRAPAELRAQQKRESAPEARTAALVKELEGQPPEKWLDRIQALRREGQAAEARDLLAEFKRRYPAHPLPRELQ